jgi:hypothetical protein
VADAPRRADRDRRLITAVTGLVLALNQLGVFDDDDSTSPAAVATSGSPGAPGDETTPGGEEAPYGVSFPQGRAATLDEHVYEVVGTRVERRNPNELALVLTMRMTNGSEVPANFWAATFRLLVDEVPSAPVDDLSEVVEGNSTGEGVVTFTIPEAPGNHVLLFRNSREVRLPLDVRETAR